MQTLLSELEVDRADVVRLDHCTAMPDGGLRDDFTGQTMSLNDSGALVARLLDGSRSLGEAADEMAVDALISPEQALADVVSFLEAADRRALLRVQRRWRVRLLPVAIVRVVLDLIVLRTRRLERRRFAPTVWGVLGACVRGMRLPLTLGVASSVPLGLLVGLQPDLGPALGILAGAGPIAVVLVVVASVVAHEWGHLSMARRRGLDCYCAISSNLTVSVLHGRGSTADQRLVAIAGPVWAAVPCLLAAAGSQAAGWPWGVAAALVLVAVGHLSSLVPWAEDGRHLFSPDQVTVPDGARA